jgi:signal transduction histidine kinase
MHEEATEELRCEIADLRASRARLLAAADADRRDFERKLHDGVQQDLVSLIVNLQLARGLCATDPAAASSLIEAMASGVRTALENLRRLAAEIYPPLLGAGGLVVALRSSASAAGVVAQIAATLPSACAPDAVATVYFCCDEALRNTGQHAGTGTHAKISIRVEGTAIVFEADDDGSGFSIAQPPAGGLSRIRDRVEALGGSLQVASEPGRGTQVRGSLPLSHV